MRFSDTDSEETSAEAVEEHKDSRVSADTQAETPENPENIENSEHLPAAPAEAPSAAAETGSETSGSKASRKRTGRRIRGVLIGAAAFLLLAGLAAAVYFNSLLDKIDYKDVSEFQQYYNLSDTDYVEQNEVYEIPLYYNESTTLEGFDRSMIDIPKEDVLNIMLLGTDLRSNSYNETGNTDSMILLSINTRDKNIKLISFMRDMYVEIPGRDNNRLNAAYSYGGPQLLFDTLQRNFDVEVERYVRVNFSNFKNIIDTVGGIDINLTKAEADYMNKFARKYKTKPVQSGLQRLDGAQALSYARCRKIDSDFKRTERQRKVILSFVEEVKHKNPAELNSLLNITLPMIQTNMSKTEIVSLFADSVGYMNNQIETLNIPIKNTYQPKTINRRSVICPNFELNKTAILAHIYSTYQLDVSETVYHEFDAPGSDDEPYTDEDGNTYYNSETGDLYTNQEYRNRGKNTNSNSDSIIENNPASNDTDTYDDDYDYDDDEEDYISEIREMYDSHIDEEDE